MPLACVPEATVYEGGEALVGEDKIRPDRHIAQPEYRVSLWPQTKRPHRGYDSDLSRGSPRLIGPHGAPHAL